MHSSVSPDLNTHIKTFVQCKNISYINFTKTYLLVSKEKIHIKNAKMIKLHEALMLERSDFLIKILPSIKTLKLKYINEVVLFKCALVIISIFFLFKDMMEM